MSLVKVNAPSDAPLSVADWYKINSVLQAVGNALGSGLSVSGSAIPRGTVLFIGGSWYVADSDTSITGTASDYVKIDHLTLAPEFVTGITNVSWNKSYNGWYDAQGNYYLFDEVKAHGAGKIDAVHAVDSLRLSVNLSKLLSRVFSDNNLARAFRVDSEIILSGSGNWTVPAGVFWIEGEIIGPGSDGAQGNAAGGGIGGTSGEELRFGYSVTPGKVIAYSITSTSTVFGGTTAAKGAGRRGSTGSGTGGQGGGYKGGAGGGLGNNGGDAVDGYGGGGGGGGVRDYVPTSGGKGALGTIRIR